MFECIFFAKGVVNYTIDKRTFRKLSDFKAAMQKAFSKTLANSYSLVVEVGFTAGALGDTTMVLTSTDYSTKLTTIESLLTATKITLDDLLDD